MAFSRFELGRAAASHRMARALCPLHLKWRPNFGTATNRRFVPQAVIGSPSLCLRTCGRIHSALMSAALMIGHHFSISAF
jgi:hypothetical protein